MNELPNKRRVDRSRGVSVVVAASGDQQGLRECIAAVRSHLGERVPIAEVSADTASVNGALARLAPADVVVISEPCLVGADWIERLGEAAWSNTNVASASALASADTPLAIDEHPEGDQDFAAFAEALAARSRVLRPRLSRAVAPCVYIRRDALELVGPLDEALDLRAAVELDFAQRCVLSGLTHVAADDVVVARISVLQSGGRGELPASLRERYPYLAETPLADSAVLGHALESAGGPAARLPVTLDARALDGAITGTHVHILELIFALTRTDALTLRLLVRAERIDRETRAVLEGLPHTQLLAAEELASPPTRSTVFHRPQQTFSPGDIALALALGERFVVSQLDLIAYRNPGYFSDAATWEDFRAASRHGLSAAERVVVFSEHTREELLADALVDDARISVVPPGLDQRTVRDPVRPAALAGDATAHGFLLCLGTDFRHKNRLFALRLLSELRERHGWRGGIVFAGTHVSPGSSAELEEAFLREHPELAETAVSLGPVSEPERAWLMQHASAIAYPSVYEGFGLVPFESALAGVPCLFAPQASLAETAPEGTTTIVPWDAAASAERAFELLSDADARERHVQALAGRAESFTWDAAAAAMIEIYRQAAAAPVRDSATLSRDVVAREARLNGRHGEEVARLIDEREQWRRGYEELRDEAGFGLSLIGPRGALPENVQRALLALSARPALSRPLFAAASRVFVLMRAFARPIGAVLRRRR